MRHIPYYYSDLDKVSILTVGSAMLGAYPGYPLSSDLKFQGRDRGYEYMERANGLGTSMLDQSMSMGASNNMEYKFSSNQLQQDAS